jgi:hypothetical protein
MRQLIEDSHLDLGLPDVETIGEDRKMPDTVIYETRRSRNVLCLIEAKLPPWDVFDEGLKDDARKKATKRQAKYFATTNFKQLVWWKTAAVNAGEPEERQIVHRYDLSQIEDLDDLDQTRFREPTRRALGRFLTRLEAVHAGREVEPRLPIDELLVYRLHEKVRVLAGHYKGIIADKCHKDTKFCAALRHWFDEQSWVFGWQESDYDKAARQAAYLLVNKILFYNLLQAKRPHDLDPLAVPEGLTKGAQLQKFLQIYFDAALKIDYETIFTTDFIDEIAFPDAKEVVHEVESLVQILRRYDFSALGYDVVGRIFEQLIPSQERHRLGQYFTRPDVVDLILRFCLRRESDVILDPACGAGTFLVRAYFHKKLMNQRLRHEEVLETLWGNDIAKFPAHLSTINLAVHDLASDKNYPNIIREDFFALPAGDSGFELPATVRRRRAVTLGTTEREVTYPRWFDAVVGNPPYTRQEEMKHIAAKEKLIARAVMSGSRVLADISARAGIHAYFFVHGTKFLKEGGRFGFIVSNSWLDVDYGKGLQEFFLKYYKVIAIIESKVERWFEDADVNTCIIILEKCSDKAARDSNLVRFVYLKKPLRHYIPVAEDVWEKQRIRIEAIDKLIQTALFHSSLYENDDLRVFPKKQDELWHEGYDPERQEYVGAKWGKYLRAPEVFFRILEKCKDKLVPLRELAKVQRGFTTGANSFFYLTEDEIKRRGIEREFWMHRDENGLWTPNYVVKSPKECRTLVVDPADLKYRVLMIHKDRDKLKGTKVLQYIVSAERKGLHKRPTMTARGERWYDLGERQTSSLGWPYMSRTRLFAVANPHACYFDCEFFDMYAPKRDATTLAALANTTLFWLMVETLARSYGGGGGPLKVQVYELLATPVVRLSSIDGPARRRLSAVFEKMATKARGDVFAEVGAQTPTEVSLENVKSDRRALDKIVMGEILGLSEGEQLEVYRAVVDLVRSRIDRAKSVDTGRRTRDGLDIDAMKDTILKHVVREP